MPERSRAVKRQKIFINMRTTMRENAFGSTERDDVIDILQGRYLLSSAELRHACYCVPTQVYVNYVAR